MIDENDKITTTSDDVETGEVEDTKKDQTDEYEKICFLCRRPESKAGKMISLPSNIYICADCKNNFVVITVTEQ